MIDNASFVVPYATAVTKYADNDFLGHRPFNTVAQTYGGYTWETYRQINQRVNAFGSGIMHLNEVILGNEQLNRWSLGIWSHGRPEWFITEMSCNTYNLVSVALYDTLGADAVEYIVNHADIQIVVSSGKGTTTLVLPVHHTHTCTHNPREIFVFFSRSLWTTTFFFTA